VSQRGSRSTPRPGRSRVANSGVAPPNRCRVHPFRGGPVWHPPTPRFACLRDRVPSTVCTPTSPGASVEGMGVVRIHYGVKFSHNCVVSLAPGPSYFRAVHPARGTRLPGRHPVPNKRASAKKKTMKTAVRRKVLNILNFGRHRRSSECSEFLRLAPRVCENGLAKEASGPTTAMGLRERWPCNYRSPFSLHVMPCQKNVDILKPPALQQTPPDARQQIGQGPVLHVQ